MEIVCSKSSPFARCKEESLLPSLVYITDDLALCSNMKFHVKHHAFIHLFRVHGSLYMI